MKKKNPSTTVNKVAKKPPEPTTDEYALLNSCFYLPGWEFDDIIKPRCCEIGCEYIGDRDGKSVFATIYGLEAMGEITRQHTIACFFIRTGAQVYQKRNLDDIHEMIQLLRKDHLWNGHICNLENI